MFYELEPKTTEKLQGVGRLKKRTSMFNPAIIPLLMYSIDLTVFGFAVRHLYTEVPKTKVLYIAEIRGLRFCFQQDLNESLTAKISTTIEKKASKHKMSKITDHLTRQGLVDVSVTRGTL